MRQPAAPKPPRSPPQVRPVSLWGATLTQHTIPTIPAPPYRPQRQWCQPPSKSKPCKRLRPAFAMRMPPMIRIALAHRRQADPLPPAVVTRTWLIILIALAHLRTRRHRRQFASPTLGLRRNVLCRLLRQPPSPVQPFISRSAIPLLSP